MIAYLQGKDVTVEVPDDIGDAELGDLNNNFSVHVAEEAGSAPPAGPKPVAQASGGGNTAPASSLDGGWKPNFWESYIKPALNMTPLGAAARLPDEFPAVQKAGEQALIDVGDAIEKAPAEALPAPVALGKTMAETPEGRAFGGKAVEALSFGAAKPGLDVMLAEEYKDHPVFATAGAVAGTLGSLLAVGGALRVAGLAGKASALASKIPALGEDGTVAAKLSSMVPRFLPNTILQSATFATKKFIEKTIEAFQDGGVDPAEFGETVLYEALGGAATGFIGGIAAAPIAVTSAATAGFMLTKSEGGDNKEAFLNAGIWAAFELVGSVGRSERLNRDGLKTVASSIGNYARKQNPTMSPEAAEALGNAIVTKEAAKFGGVEAIVKGETGKQNTLELIEQINQRIRQGKVRASAVEPPAQIEAAKPEIGTTPEPPVAPEAPAPEAQKSPSTEPVSPTENKLHVEQNPPKKFDAQGVPIRAPRSVVSQVKLADGQVAKITHEMVLDEAENLRAGALEQRGQAGALEKFVLSNKIRDFKPTETGTVPEAEEMKGVPVRFKGGQLSADEVAQMAFDRKLIPEPSADLLRNELQSIDVRGEEPKVADFYDEAQRQLEAMFGGEKEELPAWVGQDQGTTDEVAAEPRATYGDLPEIPQFKNTNEAMEFGTKFAGNKQMVEALTDRLAELDQEIAALPPGDAAFAKAFERQFVREAKDQIEGTMPKPPSAKEPSAQYNKAAREIETIALEKFGDTGNFQEAGFVLKDGRMVNVTRPTGRVEHRDVAAEIYSGSGTIGSPTDLLHTFMHDTGAVRIVNYPGHISVESHGPLSSDQMKQIGDHFAATPTDDATFSVVNEAGREIRSKAFENPTDEDVRRFFNGSSQAAEPTASPYQQDFDFTTPPEAPAGTKAEHTVTGGFKAIMKPHLEVEFKEVGSVMIPNRKIDSPADLAYAFKFLHNEAQENFFIAAVKDGKIVAVEHLGFGSIDQVAVYPYETLNLINKNTADGFFAVHNHPSGQTEPSDADTQLTRQLDTALTRSGAKFMGHVIIDDTKFGFIDPDYNVTQEDHKEYAETKKLPILKKHFEWLRGKDTITNGPKMNSPKAAFELFKGIQQGTDEAIVYLLNTQNSVLNAVVIPKDQMTAGTLQNLATAYRANGMITVNSGLSDTTYKSVKRALQQLDIRLQDDIEVKADGYRSKVEHLSEQEAAFAAEKPGEYAAENPAERYNQLKDEAKAKGMTSAEAARYAKKEITDLYSRSRVIKDGVGRIKVDPIPAKPGKKRSDILFNVSKALGKKIVYGKVPKGAGGVYKPGSGALIIKSPGDLDAAAHELAHALDDRFGILSAWSKAEPSPYDDELSHFWQHGSITTTGPRSGIGYKRAEGVAEFVRAWLVNPEAAIKQAPEFAEQFLSKIDKKARKALDEFSNDIRSFAGSTAHDQIMANVAWTPRNSGVLDFFSGGRSNPDDFQITTFDKMKALYVDSLAAYEKAVDFARQEAGTENLLPKDDPMILARLYNGIHGKMGEIFKSGMVDAEGHTVTPGGINWLLETLDATSVKTLDTEMQEAASHMFAQRTLEKIEQLDKQTVSGIGGGIFSDADVANRRIADLQADPEKFKRLQQAADRYRLWANAVLEYLHESGRISTETMTASKERNEQYVAMQRVMELGPGEVLDAGHEGGAGGNKVGVVGQPLHKFKGSGREIKNPYLSLMDATYRSVKEADRNRVLVALRELLVSKEGRELGEGDVPKLAQVGRLAKEGEPNTVAIFVNGKKEMWQFQPDVFKALKGLVENSFRFPAFMTFLPSVFRAGIVNFPPFMIRNVIRDIQTRLVVSDTGSTLLDQVLGGGALNTRNLQIYGGDQFGHYMKDEASYARAMDAAMKWVVADKNSILVHWPKLRANINDIRDFSERSGRLAEYRAAFRQATKKFGYDDYNAHLFAASKARGLMDFAVSGDFIKQINQLLPFTNAGIQGTRVSMKSADKDPRGFMLRWILFGLVPAVGEYFWNARDPEDLKQYRQMPAWRRDLFYNFKIGDDFWLTLPKAFDLGVMSSGATRLIDKMNGNEKAFDGYAGSVLKILMPLDEAALTGPFRGLVQVLTNHDFFRNKNIMPPGETKLNLELRDTSKASRLGQFLQKIVGADARNIDFMMREMFGFMGSFATKLSDTGREDRRPFGWGETGLFVGSPAYAARDVQWVMNEASRRDLTTHPHYQYLQRYIDRYWDAKEGEPKEKAAKDLTDYAAGVREKWEKQMPGPRTPKIRRRLAELLKGGT